MRRHHASHAEEPGEICPLCRTKSSNLDNRSKADCNDGNGVVGTLSSPWREFAMSHDSTMNMKPYRLRNATKSSDTRLTTFRNRSSRQKTSKVTFSPQIVERRVAYHGQHKDTEQDGKVDPIATASPRRSNMRESTAKKSTKRIALKIDTSDNVTKHQSNVKEEIGFVARKL